MSNAIGFYGKENLPVSLVISMLGTDMCQVMKWLKHTVLVSQDEGLRVRMRARGKPFRDNSDTQEQGD